MIGCIVDQGMSVFSEYLLTIYQYCLTFYNCIVKMNTLSVCSFPQTYLDLVFPCILWKYINIINYKKGPQFAQRIEIEL